MASLMDRINAKRAQIAENKAGQTRLYKFKPGKTVISFLPLTNDLELPPDQQEFYRPFGQHYLKNRKGEIVAVVGDRSICYNEPDPIRDLIVEMMRDAQDKGDTAMAEAAKESLAKPGYLMNIMVHLDPDNKTGLPDPQLISMSENMFDGILSVTQEFAADDEGAMLRFDNRLVFVVERTGTSKTDTRYNTIPAAKRLTVKKEVMDKAVNIDTYISAQFRDGVNRALAFLSTMLGRPVADLAGTAFVEALTAPPGGKPAALPAPASATEAVDILADLTAPATKADAPALTRAKAVDAEYVEVKTPPANDSDDLLAEIEALTA